MPPQPNKAIKLIRYSPRPIEEYGKPNSPARPANSRLLSDPAAWNLAFLSFDYGTAVMHPDPNFTTLVRRTVQSALDGSGPDLTGVKGDHELVGHWLYLTPPEFVYQVTRHSVLKSLPMYQAYGQEWLRTIDHRAYMLGASKPDPVLAPLVEACEVLQKIGSR